MKKSFLIVIFSLALLLTACSGADSSTPTQAPQTDAVDQTADTSQPDDANPPPTPTDLQEVSLGSGEAMTCNVVGLLPPPDPTQQALFPLASDEDWIKGADSAQVTVVEYSDFQ